MSLRMFLCVGISLRVVQPHCSHVNVVNFVCRKNHKLLNDRNVYVQLYCSCVNAVLCRNESV